MCSFNQGLIMYFFCLCISVSVPERLEFVVNKYAEHTHEKWSLEKVSYPGLDWLSYLCTYFSLPCQNISLYWVPDLFFVFCLVNLCVFSASLSVAGFMESTYVRTPKFTLASSRTGLLLKRYRWSSQFLWHVWMFFKCSSGMKVVIS